LLGDQQRAHAVHLFVADALVQGGVVRRTDLGVVRQDSVTFQHRFDLARQHGDALGPCGHGGGVGRGRFRQHDPARSIAISNSSFCSARALRFSPCSSAASAGRRGSFHSPKVVEVRRRLLARLAQRLVEKLQLAGGVSRRAIISSTSRWIVEGATERDGSSSLAMATPVVDREWVSG